MSDGDGILIAVIVHNKVVQTQLGAVLQAHGFANVAVYVRGDALPTGCESVDGSYEDSGALRAGRLMDSLTLRLQALRLAAQPALIAMGAWVFDVHNNVLRQANSANDMVRLTDKERDVLLALYEAGGAPVSREALLDKVWGYAESVETHTIETHIYRVRQKIEDDPNSPKLLVRVDEGYCLKL